MAQMSLSTKQKQIIAKENRLVVPKGKWRGRGMDEQCGVLEANLLQRMGNEALLYSTGNCVWLGHTAVQENLRKHCRSTILQWENVAYPFSMSSFNMLIILKMSPLILLHFVSYFQSLSFCCTLRDCFNFIFFSELSIKFFFVLYMFPSY